MLQGDDARRAPFFSDFILKENLDRFVEPIGVNQTLGHGMASSTQTATMRKGRLISRRPYIQAVPTAAWRSRHTGTWASIAQESRVYPFKYFARKSSTTFMLAASLNCEPPWPAPSRKVNVALFEPAAFSAS